MKKILISLALFMGVFCSCEKDDELPVIDKAQYTGDSWEGLNSPWVKDADTYNHTTLWSCIYYGSYPTNEVVDRPFTAVDDYALAAGDVILNATLFSRLEQAEWTNDETTLDGTRYRRINASGAVNWATNRAQHYRWADASIYHYFAYVPIRWRILNITGNKALLLADRMPDSHPFHLTDVDISWSDCDLRRWLNSEFFARAFTETERLAVLETEVRNAPNYYFGTTCGPDTRDHVFILSEAEVFSSSLAMDYGFYPGDGTDDPARRFRSTLYAKCRGAWWSPVEGYQGNSFWMMRSSGYTGANVTYVCDFGYLYNRGTVVTCDDAALLPAITIDLSQAPFTVAPSVSSTDIIR